MEYGTGENDGHRSQYGRMKSAIERLVEQNFSLNEKLTGLEVDLRAATTHITVLMEDRIRSNVTLNQLVEKVNEIRMLPIEMQGLMNEERKSLIPIQEKAMHNTNGSPVSNRNVEEKHYCHSDIGSLQTDKISLFDEDLSAFAKRYSTLLKSAHRTVDEECVRSDMLYSSEISEVGDGKFFSDDKLLQRKPGWCVIKAELERKTEYFSSPSASACLNPAPYDKELDENCEDTGDCNYEIGDHLKLLDDDYKKFDDNGKVLRATSIDTDQNYPRFCHNDNSFDISVNNIVRRNSLRGRRLSARREILEATKQNPPEISFFSAKSFV